MVIDRCKSALAAGINITEKVRRVLILTAPSAPVQGTWQHAVITATTDSRGGDTQYGETLVPL